MVSGPDTNAKHILSALDNPQFKEVISVAVVLGMLLLFARDLTDPSGFRNYLIGGLIVYLITTILLVQTQVNLINHAINQAGTSPEHFPSFQESPTAKRVPFVGRIVGWCEDLANTLGYLTLRCMPLLRVTLLVLLIVYLFYRKCL
jgi:hypothetical protein